MSKPIFGEGPKHPVIKMSKTRAMAWLKEASDEDYYQFLRTLSAIYAKRKYKGDGHITDQQLIDDYLEWRKEVVEGLET